MIPIPGITPDTVIFVNMEDQSYTVMKNGEAVIICDYPCIVVEPHLN